MSLFYKLFSAFFVAFLLLITAKIAMVEAGGFQKIEYINGLEVSTDVAFTPDGRMLVAEKEGTIRVIQNDQLLAQPLADISDHVNNFGDRGLLSIAVDPDFSINGYIYLLYTFQSPTTPNDGFKTARLSRIQVDPLANVATPQINPSETILLGSIDVPYGDGTTACQPGTDCISTDSASHTVGEVIFAPDKTMYVSIGDGSDFNMVDVKALRAQDLDWMLGKVLHIDRNGKGIIGNPFYTGNPDDVRSKVYHYGLRNPFRISYDSDFGLYVTDTGWNLWEEVNRGAAGSNFGWPCYEGNEQQPAYMINALTGTMCQQVYAQNNHIVPLFAYSHEGSGAAIAGGAIYKGSTYPEQFQNNYFYADYNDMYLRRLVLDASGNFVSDEEFMTDVLGPINVFNFPDGDIGAIYVWGGQIYKFNFDPTNRIPVAVASADVQSGDNPLTVQFDGSGSSDLDVGDVLSYNWDFGDGNSSELESPAHTFTVNGTYTTTLTVTDLLGASNSATLRIDVGNHAPEVSITSPKSNEGFIDFVDLNYSGSATDQEDGDLASTQLSWDLVLHHNEHEHLLIDGGIGANGSVHLDYHGENTYYELRLTATDSSGLSSTVSHNFYIYPKNNICAEGSQCLGLWHFDNDASDATEGNNDGTINGNVICSVENVGRVGGACVFNGDGGNISTPAQSLTVFTLNTWVKPNDGTNIQVIASNKNGGFTENGFSLFLNAWETNNRQIIFELGDGVSGQHIGSVPDTAVSNQWQMITVSFDGTDVTIYKNGIQVAKQAASFDFLKNAPIYFGSYANNVLSLSGALDDTSIWGRVLSPADITSLYTQAPVCDAIPAFGSIKFGIREFSVTNEWTGGFLNDVTVKLTDPIGETVYQIATSSAYGTADGRAEFVNVPVGNYGILAYKTGYEGVWKQTTCEGAGTSDGATINNSNTEGNIAVWNDAVTITADTITWCQDLGLKAVEVPQEYGDIKFGIKEFNPDGSWTGGYINGVTVKLTDVSGENVIAEATSETSGGKDGRVRFLDVPVGNYGIIAYKTGYEGVWKQTTCEGAGTTDGATINNLNTNELTAAWNNEVGIVADTTTWCKDLGLRQNP